MPDAQPARRIAQVRVDRTKCFSQEQCVATAPRVFSLDGEQISTVGDIALADDETLLAAAYACPMQAILVLDAEGNQLYPEINAAW